VTLDEIEEGAGEGDTDIGGLEDSDDELEDEGYIDWAKFEIGENGELSAWDQLGAGYDREFASIGMSWLKFCSDIGPRLIWIQNKNLGHMILQYVRHLLTRSRLRQLIETGQ
jgi:hypothetical protein